MLREKLLNLDDGLNVKPSEYAMTLIPFRDIALEHGTTDAIKIFAYVYYMRDPRSTFAGYSEDVRHIEVSKKIFGKDFKVDKLTKKALDFYNEAETSTLKLLRAARTSVDKLQMWLDQLDINDDNYNVMEHTKVLESLGKTTESLKKLEDAAVAETSENTVYGGVQLNKYSE
jgi:hypothetical protein